jgi:hypothetical protein
VLRRNADLQLRCYVDASYLTHQDSKSHTGYTMSFGTIGTFYSKSLKQTAVSTSSMHAEMRALYTLCVDIIFVVNLCRELNRELRLPAIVFVDNKPSIDVTESISSRTKRCKHFLMLISYVRELVCQGMVKLEKVKSDENVADVLTKIVTGGAFRSKAELLCAERFMEYAKFAGHGPELG